ncbi:MAG TPA: SGNH/GDSL hydrolase family protein [Polyangia bacterium]|nr:SGNH/GDSL hydrolase family protein [Polyangia bacterium]
MPLGDSITWGYGSSTGGGYRVGIFSQAVAANKSITFVGSQTTGPTTVSGKPFPKGNEGHSGYSIDDSSQTSGIAGALTDGAISTYRPNVILLMIGTNDMHYSIDLPNAPTRLGNLLDEITADAPNALVVVATIIPANGAQNTPTQTYNAAIPAVVQARSAKGKHLVLVDMYAAMKSWSTSIYTDSEHPNDAGYTIMANTWYPALRGVLP